MTHLNSSSGLCLRVSDAPFGKELGPSVGRRVGILTTAMGRSRLSRNAEPTAASALVSLESSRSGFHQKRALEAPT